LPAKLVNPLNKERTGCNPPEIVELPATAALSPCTMRRQVLSFSQVLNNQAKISYQLSSGYALPALSTESLGELIHPFRGWLSQGNTARQYPLAAMSEMFHLPIVAVETGALGRPV